MATKYVAAAITDPFSCPYPDCYALAHQIWFELYTFPFKKGTRPSTDISPEYLDAIDRDDTVDDDRKKQVRRFCEAIWSGRIQLSPERDEGHGHRLVNLNICQCFSCEKFSVWNGAKLIFPAVTIHVTPNPDFADDIQRDFLEAAEILDRSPRGSAALLRLCVQKLCKQLGEKGKNINDDIAALVKKGLDGRIQQALDVVRVIGNEAVHPGQMDLCDDVETARKLFSLVNLIADGMISQPKVIAEMFQNLPASKLQEIDKRDR